MSCCGHNSYLTGQDTEAQAHGHKSPPSGHRAYELSHGATQQFPCGGAPEDAGKETVGSMGVPGSTVRYERGSKKGAALLR